MSEIINFDEVQQPESKPAATFKRVEKGAQKLTITAIVGGESASGTPFAEVTFHSERFDADFPHKFYLSQKALSRVQSLMIGFTGEKLTGSIDTSVLPEQLATTLVGKTSNCIVDARAVDKEVNGKVYTNEYADLRYADFASLTTEFKDSDARVKNESAPASVKQDAGLLVEDSDSSDLPF